MRTFDKIIIFLGVIMAIVAAGFVLPVVFGKTSNCGQNSSALNVCKFELLELRLASEKIGPIFNLDQMPATEKADLIRYSKDHWIPEAKILIKTNINLRSVTKQIVMVCDTFYSNVPQPRLWNGYRVNPAHAVGYSDGSSGLISPAEFKKLNLSEFIDASLISTNLQAAENKSVLK